MMMFNMIRKAEDKDVPELIDLTISFCKTTPISSLAEVSREKITEAYLDIIIEGKGICFVSLSNTGIEGFIIGSLGELPFTTEKSGVVICWWVTPTRQGLGSSEKLLEAFTEESRRVGARNIVIAAVEPPRGRTIERLYKRELFKEYETVYVKDLR
jgi:N-acetylglutamate synthase-like GNAT family acetyltransferase